MKQPVLCELCNKSYAIGVMKKHKQSKMHIENARPETMVENFGKQNPALQHGGGRASRHTWPASVR
jgi:hypothetical protein